ncbi:Serine/threonine-protein kinase CBK1 [Nakaseomyces bracarensis]|uniref:Serine/threonine-protein kinase CBK1 n=1 Tax=Nakaseomyces bracarensis TaxID=273131 RepID=A0ABR4NUQ3_9SACH
MFNGDHNQKYAYDANNGYQPPTIDNMEFQQLGSPGVNEHYLRQQASNQSLQDQYSAHMERQQQPLGGGFTDIPQLHPSTPPHGMMAKLMANNSGGNHNNNMNNNIPNGMFNSPPPTMGNALYSHGNNSGSLLQDVRNQQFSPDRYSVDSDYNSNGNLNQARSQASSPFHQPQSFYNNSNISSGQLSANRTSPQHHPIQPQLQNNFNQLPPPTMQASIPQQQQIQPHGYQHITSQQQMQPQPSQPIQQEVVQPQNGGNYMYFERKPDLLSKNTQDKAAAVKLKIENYYQQSVKYAIERNERRVELETELGSHNWSEERNARQLSSLGKKESQFLRLRRTRLSLEDFHTVQVIGKGAFGEVRLVQKKDTGKIYAMKTLLKSEMYKKDQLAHVKAERDVLAGTDSPWIVSLYYSFQDAQYLYLIMEFLPGGDLMTMLIRWQLFTEDVTRFYMAECILAIETIHKLGFIHRDIKPDNILIDIRGHIKLSDFGLSTGFHKTHDSNYYKKLLQQDEAGVKGGNGGAGSSDSDGQNTNRQTMIVDSINLTMSNRQQIQTWRKSRRLMAYSTVGTPDYIAPEIFLYQGYGQDCDWWSLGAIMYECLIGWPPFCSETPQETYRKIMNFEQTLQFPEDVHISYEAEDLIRRLLTHADNRLGRHGGADEIKSHPFFRGVDWNTIRQVEAPYIPKLSSITDTRFFPTDELENVPDSPAMAQAAKQREQMMKNGLNPNQNQNQVKEDLPFIGYTYSRFDYLTRKNAL